MRDDYLRIGTGRRVDYFLPGFLGGVDAALAEEVLSLGIATDCFNFDFSDGTLRAGFGAQECFVSHPRVCNVFGFARYDFELERREEIVMFSTLDGEVFYYPHGERENYLKLEGVRLNGVPRAVGYRLYGEDVVLLCSDCDPMIVWDGKNPAYSVTSSPFITSLAIHFERMFVTTAGQKNAVWFSDDLDPTNWSLELEQGGFVEMMDERGALNKVISYLNYIYIFRDYGISRLSAYAEQTDFSVSNLFVSSGRIYPETVCLCGDRVIFLADDGLYSFDGLSTVRILGGLSGLFEQGKNAVATFAGGKYYLAFGLREAREGKIGCENGEFVNNGLLVFDIAKKSYSISRGMDIVRLCPVLNEVFAVLNGGKVCKICKCGTMLGVPLKKKWSIPKTDFGKPDRLKFIKNLYIFTKDDIELLIRTDTQEKIIAVSGRSIPQRVPINISGVRIGADIVARTATPEISRVLIRVCM